MTTHALKWIITAAAIVAAVGYLIIMITTGPTEAVRIIECEAVGFDRAQCEYLHHNFRRVR